MKWVLGVESLIVDLERRIALERKHSETMVWERKLSEAEAHRRLGCMMALHQLLTHIAEHPDRYPDLLKPKIVETAL